MASSAVVVVGVDGSEPSREALRYAAREANRRGATLRVVAAFDPPEYWPRLYCAVEGASSREVAQVVRGEVSQMIDETFAELGVRLDVDLVLVAGRAVPALLDAAQDADTLVLGHRGRSAMASVLLGSVALRCALHASCPITIVRPAAGIQHDDVRVGERAEQQLTTGAAPTP
jgi:nucleotide-binding universal stress UspA family protein